jgi:signal peptidase I
MDESQKHEHTEPFSHFAHRHRHSVESFVTLFEWLLVAFILALLFQGFAMQAFQIPTGSMAETLRGAHYSLRCTQCGYSFDVGSDSITIDRPQCPSCDYTLPPNVIGSMRNGDRIFVLKSIYQFFQPKRWDVVVFKNPTNPRENYIKRLIALPEETVQLIYGDVFINGQIVRKPVNVQKELWMPIFLQDHQAFDRFQEGPERTPSGQRRYRPQTGFVNDPNSAWQVDRSICILNDDSGRRQSLAYQTENPHDFNAFYSYNESNDCIGKPIVSDLMLTFYAQLKGQVSCIGATLEKGGVLYSAYADRQGTLVFERTVNGQTQELRRAELSPVREAGFIHFEFANVDRQLVLRWGDRRMTYDLTKDPDYAAPQGEETQIPQVAIFGQGQVQIRHIGLFRDTYYLGSRASAVRGTEDKPFTLKSDQFFVCGDNSNNSLDSRLWNIDGIGNNGHSYDMGTVPRDYMMGKAMFVYWSQALKPVDRMPPVVPNLGNVKLIFGGSDQEY